MISNVRLSNRPARALRLSLLLAALCQAPLSPALASGIGDQIVAVVNTDVITQKDVEHRTNRIIANFKQQQIPLPELPVLQRQVLERLILEQLQVQTAQERNIKVERREVDLALARLAAQNNTTVNDFLSQAATGGLSEASLRQEVTTELILAKLKNREIHNGLRVSESEIDRAVSTMQARQNSQLEYELEHVLIRLPDSATTEQIFAQNKRASQALADLATGKIFAQVAASYSDAPDALSGGKLGWRSASRLPVQFLEHLQSLQPGQTSGVFRSPNGFHILRLLATRGRQDSQVIQKIHARHILLKTSERLSDAEAASRLNALRQRILGGEPFVRVAAAHSDDASAIRGGDIGWIGPNETVPEFERALHTLQPGEISQPVQTAFGWHLIQVVAKRNEDVSREREREVARQEVLQRKADEAYQQWLRQLRDGAHVEYRSTDL